MDLINVRDTKPNDLIRARDMKNVDRRGTGISNNSTLTTNRSPANVAKESDGGGTSTTDNFPYPTATVIPAIPTNTGSTVDLCQMCIILGIQVMCPNDVTKRKHTEGHRRAAAAFLNFEDWALPPAESQISKCFPLYVSSDFIQQRQPTTPQTFINSPGITTAAIAAAPNNQKFNSQQQQIGQLPPHSQQQQQPSQRNDNEKIQQTVAAILLSSSSPNSSAPSKSLNLQQQLSTAESRAASITAAVAAVASSVASQQPANHDPTSIVLENKKRGKSKASNESAKKRAKIAPNSSPIKAGEGSTSALTAKEIREQMTKTVVAAIETTLCNGNVETNFQVLRDKPSCKWPRFIIDGYAYRVGRVYSTGKCELRCILKQGCNGKAVVEKSGTTYVARIVPGSVHFHSPPSFVKTEANA